MKIFGFNISRSPISNYSMGVEYDALRKSVKIEVSPPSRSAKDMEDYVRALRLAEDVNIPRRYKIYEIYQESIDYDAHMQAAMSKRVNSLLQKKFIYVNNSGNEIKKVTEWMEAPEFRQFLKDILETKFWGHSLFEFTPGQWFSYELIPRKNVEPREGLVLTRSYDTTGVPYRVPRFKKYVMEVGSHEDLGLLKTGARYAIYKRNLLSDWANYSELAGNNFERFTYTGEDQAVKQQIDEMIAQGGVGMRMRLPRDVDFDIKSGSSSSTNQLFENFHEIMNKELSKLFLGQTMTMDDGSSRSQSEVHSEQQDMVLMDDLLYVLNILNYEFIDYIGLWNLPKGRFERKQETKDKPLVMEITPAGAQEVVEIVKSSIDDDQKIALLRVLFNIDKADAKEMISTPEPKPETTPEPEQEPEEEETEPNEPNKEDDTPEDSKQES